ncbi:mucin-6-like isoform X2 [Oryzias latipes]|uniref:mucin-6-like isoform X2 n=1 Tax=Oryzias latipes TaxID=8090 RepID=UPI000CE234D6|nr:mucin-6-like isoform X2 [Oryzias latipes]
MAVAYGTIGRPGLLSQQYGPPLLPKPGKDNARLQKLLKRTAKKKASAQASQSTAPFRSSLSPVNEASPDLERSDHFTPPRTPETSPSLFGIQQPPRFTVRPLYQHVPSPYPQRAAFGRAAKMSPPTVALPSYSSSQHAATILSHSTSAHHSEVPTLMEHGSQPVVAKISQLYSIMPDVILPTPGPSSYIPSEGHAVIRPLTVLTTIVKSRSPRPTFKATEPSKSPKPMFEVPQIRMYTASTSYYETTRTPPVYDSAGLTAIGSTVSQSKTSTEIKQKITEASEVRGGGTPTAQTPSLKTDPQRHTTLTGKMGSSPFLGVDTFKNDAAESKIATSGLKTNGSTLIPIFQRRSPVPEIQRATPTSVVQRATPTSVVQRATPTSYVQRAIPTSDVQRATPTSDVQKATPTFDIQKATPTSDVQKATATYVVQRATPTSVVQIATPTSDVQKATPTFDIQKATPTSVVQRATPTSVVQRATPTSYVQRAIPTSDVQRATPTSDVQKATPTFDIQKATPTSDVQKATATYVVQRATPTSVVQKATPTSDVQKATPTFDIQKATPTSVVQRAIPTSDVQRATPTSVVQRATPTSDVQRATPTSVVQRATPTSDVQKATPTFDIQKATPTSDVQKATATSVVQRATPTSVVQRAIPTSDVQRATPTSVVQRATPTSVVQRATPTSDVQRATPTSVVQRATPTSDVQRATPTSDVQRATPTSDIKHPSFEAERVKTSTYEFQTSRNLVGRPRTPAYYVTRPTTPIFEVSRPNPLLFAVSPITVESERPKTDETLSEVSSLSTHLSGKSAELHKRLANGDISSVEKPDVKTVQQSITEPKPCHDLTKGRISTPADGVQKAETPSPGPLIREAAVFQRPKTPTYEASRLMTISPGYKRPKTPTYGISAPNVSGTAIQKLPAPLSQKQKSAYRGLTPAEYAAYGGIKTYSPAFGISSFEMATTDEVKAEKEIPGESSQEPKLKQQTTSEVVKTKENPEDLKELVLVHHKLSAMPSTPVIVVSQAADSCETTLPEGTETVSVDSVAKQDVALVQTVEKYPTPTCNTSESHGEGFLTQHTKTNGAETKPEESSQDPLKAVKRLLGKNKEFTADAEVKTGSKANIYAQQEQEAQTSVTTIKPEGPKPSLKALDQKTTTIESDGGDKQREETPEKVSEEKKETENLLPSEPPVKVMQKLKSAKSKGSGWSRLKKHMVVEQEEPKFPEKGSQKEVTEQDQDQERIVEDTHKNEPRLQDENQPKEMATKMWDAVLFQMFSSKENIMHQIELNQSEEDKNEEENNELKEIPSFAYRLPVLLFSPKFDAKKLKEAASRPVTKISTVFEMGLIGRKSKDEEPKDFNRTARGFTST